MDVTYKNILFLGHWLRIRVDVPIARGLRIQADISSSAIWLLVKCGNV